MELIMSEPSKNINQPNPTNFSELCESHIKRHIIDDLSEKHRSRGLNIIRSEVVTLPVSFLHKVITNNNFSVIQKIKEFNYPPEWKSIGYDELFIVLKKKCDEHEIDKEKLKRIENTCKKYHYQYQPSIYFCFDIEK